MQIECRVALGCLPSQIARKLHNLRNLLRRVDTRQLDYHVDTGDMPGWRHDSVNQQGFLAGNSANTLQVLRAETRRMANQVFDNQLIPVGTSVLEVRQRIDPDRVGNLPGLLGQPCDRLQRLDAVHIAVRGRHDKQHIIRLGVGVLQGLERYQLRIFRAEKDPVIILKA